jgi:hypothetical protein
VEPKTKRDCYPESANAGISVPKTGVRKCEKPKGMDIAVSDMNDRIEKTPIHKETNEAVLQHLREVIYHKLKMWDASNAAEKLLGREIDTGYIDDFCIGVDHAEDAMKLTESEIKEAFELEENHETKYR